MGQVDNGAALDLDARLKLSLPGIERYARTACPPHVLFKPALDFMPCMFFGFCGRSSIEETLADDSGASAPARTVGEKES